MNPPRARRFPRREAIRATVGVALVAVAMCGAAAPAVPAAAPRFELAAAPFDESKARGLLVAMARGDCSANGVPPRTPRGPVIQWKCGGWLAELDTRTGNLFVADMTRLWKATPLGPLPSCRKAQALARAFRDTYGLDPPILKGVSLEFAGCTSTQQVDKDGGRPKRLDVQVVYMPAVAVGSGFLGTRSDPVIGLSAKVRVTFAGRDEVIAFSGWLPRLTQTEQAWQRSEVPVAEPPEVAAVAARRWFWSRKRSWPVYHAQTDANGTATLTPAWLVNPNDNVKEGDPRVPLRIVSAAESDGRPEAAALCGGDSRPTSFDPPPPDAHTLNCATEWLSNQLPNSCANKQGFVDGCRAAGGKVLFDFGDRSAIQDDFAGHNNRFVDSADLVFYSGHASSSGWELNEPDKPLMVWENLTAHDGYGDGRMKWLVISACGPLHSREFLTKAFKVFPDSALLRWKNAFRGLHALLGFGSDSVDTPDEGRLFMELTGRGWGVIDAWFRTAQDTQPVANRGFWPVGPGIYVVAMYAHNGDNCTRNEQLGNGGGQCSIRPDGQTLELLWSGT
ncbi:MAG: DUF6345 domain-containing protein [Gammaproteobacteria bacterium]